MYEKVHNTYNFKYWQIFQNSSPEAYSSQICNKVVIKEPTYLKYFAKRPCEYILKYPKVWATGNGTPLCNCRI